MEQPEVPFPPDIKVGPGYDDALRAMVDRDWLQSQSYQSQQWRAKRDGMHPWMLKFEPKLVKRMAKLGVPMFCATGIRSAAEQAKVASEGFSKLKDGPHMYGCAVDIVHGTKAWGLTRRQWDLVGHVGKGLATQLGLDLEWGGDWRDPWDPAHWQVRGWRMVASGFPFPVFGD